MDQELAQWQQDVVARRVSGDAAVLAMTSGTLDAVERVMVDMLAEGVDERIGSICVEHLRAGGKRIRARLAIASVLATGGSLETAIPWAAAVELLHNATLIHDDLQDGDVVRRGRPTVWATHGAAEAINAGDLLLTLPYLAVERIPTTDANRWKLASAMAAAAVATVRGQSLESVLQTQRPPSRQTHQRVQEGKTGALLALPVVGAGLLAGWSEDRIEAVRRVFVDLGVLFQWQDDVVDLYGAKGREEPGRDICEGKVSALVLSHVEHCPNESAWLFGILDTPRDETPSARVDEVIERFRTAGTLDRLLQDLHALRERCLSAPVLHDHPRLRQLAQELADLSCQPIAHLYPGATLSRRAS